MAFKIFKTDLCNNMPYGDSPYFERISKNLDKYPTVRDTLQGLNNNILIKKSNIDKLTLVKSNLEALLLSLFITTIYFYSTILLNAQQVPQIQNNLIKRIHLIYVFNYLLPLLLFCIVIKELEKYVRSKFKIEQNNNNEKRERKEKLERKENLKRQKNKNNKE